MRYDIKITRIKDESSNLLGYADVSLGGAFAIKGIKIMNGSNGPFVSMPNYKSKRISEDGEPIYKDVCYASKADFRKELTSNVLAAYEGNDSPSISKVSCAILANDGNLKGIGCLLKGRSVDEVIDTLTGVTCGNKPTSCPDQIACALKAYRG